jgi:hypothetical protein
MVAGLGSLVDSPLDGHCKHSQNKSIWIREMLVSHLYFQHNAPKWWAEATIPTWKFDVQIPTEIEKLQTKAQGME